jgi:uncharacterized protein involved in exopolysaccharide biosynthesis
MTYTKVDPYPLGPTGMDAPPDRNPIGLLSLFGVLLRNRRQIIAFAILVPVALVGLILLRDRTYTTAMAFLPQGKRPPANLASLALQLGVNMPSGMDAAQSPAFYADLIKSRVILSQVTAKTYPLTADTTQRVSLPDALDIDDGHTPQWRRGETIRELVTKVVNVSSSPRTGVVSFTVVTTSPYLSHSLAQAIIDAVSKFNQEIRQSQARSEREFTAQQLREARAALTAAETAQEEFNSANRVCCSPALAMRRDQIQREVTLRTQVLTTLQQSYEQARIEEVRDTPVLTIIDPPEVAVRPNARGASVAGIGGLALGLMLGIAFSLLRDRKWRTEHLDEDDVRALWDETVRDLLRPWRLLRRNPKRA